MHVPFAWQLYQRVWGTVLGGLRLDDESLRCLTAQSVRVSGEARERLETKDERRKIAGRRSDETPETQGKSVCRQGPDSIACRRKVDQNTVRLWVCAAFWGCDQPGERVVQVQRR